jgi:hypothetical protein
VRYPHVALLLRLPPWVVARVGVSLGSEHMYRHEGEGWEGQQKAFTTCLCGVSSAWTDRSVGRTFLENATGQEGPDPLLIFSQRDLLLFSPPFLSPAFLLSPPSLARFPRLKSFIVEHTSPRAPSWLCMLLCSNSLARTFSF